MHVIRKKLFKKIIQIFKIKNWFPKMLCSVAQDLSFDLTLKIFQEEKNLKFGKIHFRYDKNLIL